MDSIIFATIDNGCYEIYLGLCSIHNMIIMEPDTSPARIYNRILEATPARYVCFIHSDVTCNGLEAAIMKTIAEYPGHILCAVGVDGPQGYKWSKADTVSRLITGDSCCVVIDKEMGLMFDDKTFNGFHCYVEDICMQAGKVSTILIDAFDGLNPLPAYPDKYVIHHSHTLRRSGAAWGDYWKYRALLETKWPGVQTT